MAEGTGLTGSAVVNGGVCIDLRLLDEVTVDPASRTAKVGAGCTWGQVDAATQAHGLAVTGGRVSTTGVAGLALGSGSGWLERAFGFTCDNLGSAKVVTADGRLVIAAERENPDLFWGLRGGGGNFGIVTELTFSLHALGPIVLGAMLMYPAAMAGDLVRFWRDFMLQAPDEVGGGVAFITAPPLEFVPEPVRGQPVVGVLVCYACAVKEGRRVMAPLLGARPAGGQHGAADAARRAAAAARRREPEGHAELLDRGLPLRAARRGRGHARLPRATRPGVAAVAGHPGPRWWNPARRDAST